MTVDDVIKVLLGIGVTFSLVGISFQIMRLLDVLTNSISDLRKALQNISTASDMIIEDYEELRGGIRLLVGAIQGINDILAPLRLLVGLASGKSKK